MPKIAISQRVDIHPSLNERRDALDQRWLRFLEKLSCEPLIIPNNPPLTASILASHKIDGIILTGGNDLSALGGDTPERDQTEEMLLEYASLNDIPLVGVCRGLQFLLWKAGARLSRIEHHVGVTHPISGRINRDNVNSYHNWGYAGPMPVGYDLLAVSPDGQTEAIKSQNGKIFGIMWHPERVSPFSLEDISLFKSIFTGTL